MCLFQHFSIFSAEHGWLAKVIDNHARMCQFRHFSIYSAEHGWLVKVIDSHEQMCLFRHMPDNLYPCKKDPQGQSDLGQKAGQTICTPAKRTPYDNLTWDRKQAKQLAPLQKGPPRTIWPGTESGPDNLHPCKKDPLGQSDLGEKVGQTTCTPAKRTP